MRDRITGVGRRLLATFGSFTPGQKAMTVFAVLALAVGGYFFATWAAKPTYAPLFSNLAAADASAIVDKLNADGVAYTLSNGGQTINVPQAQVYDLRLKMSGAGLPAQSDTGYALLDKQGVMTSEFMQHVDYQRAMEGELAKTIKSISGVTAATVHLAIPQKDVFTDDQKKPTASVLVATGIGKSLTDDQVQAVVHLVSSSIEGMDAAGVTVVGADGTVMSGNGASTGGTGGDARTRQTQAYEQRVGSSLQRMLDQVVGAGHAVVQVTADLDYDQVQTKTQTYIVDPSAPPLSQSKKTETYTGSGTPAGGVLGPDNIAVPAGAGGNGNYNNSTVTQDNALGTRTEDRTAAPGAVRRLSVAVLLDSKTTKSADQARLQQIVSSAVGLDANRGDSIAVSTMPFDTSAATATKKELDASTKADQTSQLYGMIKTGAIVGAVLLLIVGSMLSSRRRNKRLSKLLKAEVAQFDGESPKAATKEIGGGDGERLALEPAAPADPAVVERAERQREIAALVEKQPEEVAQLLRGWLADRRG
jgi:flagellar M-ring protein FliF